MCGINVLIEKCREENNWEDCNKCMNKNNMTECMREVRGIQKQYFKETIIDNDINNK